METPDFNPLKTTRAVRHFFHLYGNLVHKCLLVCQLITLVCVYLTEKRDSLPVTPTMRRVANSFASDDEPLYDSVASDEDYSSVVNLSV